MLHYAQEVFEGLKAFRHADGSVWTFRPEKNAERLQRSARRLALPELPTEDFLASLICDKLFERFPNVRVASVENGSGFLRSLLKNVDTVAYKMPGWFADQPSETFRRNIWINPFWEDDVTVLEELMGPERILFGSDWPHIEGLPAPLDYLEEVSGFDASDRARIMGANAAELLAPPR